MGGKLRKISNVGSITTQRDYIGGAEYSKVASGTSAIEMIQTEEGYLENNSGTYVYHYNLTEHLGSVRATLQRSTATTGTVIQKDDYYPFGMRKLVSASGKNDYLYNGKEIQSELGGQYDYGARFYDPEIGRWNVMDPMAEKYYSSTPFNYVDNNPISRVYPNGMDWIYSTSKGRDGQERIHLTYYMAVMNSSGADIDMGKFMSEQMDAFKNVFSQGNVDAKMIIRQVNSAHELNDFESLIDIQKGGFRENEDGSFVGGSAAYGGKFIRLNADAINKDGRLHDKKIAIHEIGHTGGLIHTFEPDMKGEFFNGRIIPTGMQQFYNAENSMAFETNFMNYSREAMKSFSQRPGALNYFNNTVGKATRGQIQTILNNIHAGNVNYNNIKR